RVTNISVEGDVELGSDITISVYRTNTDTIDEVITPRPDGVFMHKVDLEEGENVIVVSANDNAMNPTSVTRRVFVDTMAPLCTITSPEEGTVTSVNTIRVTGSAEVEGITLYLNGKQINNDGTVDRYVNLNEGTNVITLRAVDPIGNEFDDFVTVYLDTQAPLIEPIRPRAQYLMTNQADLIVQALVYENRDLASITVMGNEVSWSPVTDQENTYQFETTVILTKQGENDVLVVAYDDAGNAATHTITVDFSTVKPILFLVFSPSGSNIESDNPNFYITGTTSAGIEEVWVTQTTVTADSARVPVEDGTFSVVRTLLEGENKFSVSVTDDYGNTNTTSDYTVSYVYKSDTKDDKITEPGIGPETWALWILVIAIALFITAVIVTRMLRSEK
ncbi:MAG: cadherin-like beta sandwich domain-containing protein, partial [Thermoplasmata archaeon]|nr:cadherin-like beta sandwich domain-containing protein [Thermoplasmata archaeon]